MSSRGAGGAAVWGVEGVAVGTVSDADGPAGDFAGAEACPLEGADGVSLFVGEIFDSGCFDLADSLGGLGIAAAAVGSPAGAGHAAASFAGGKDGFSGAVHKGKFGKGVITACSPEKVLRREAGGSPPRHMGTEPCCCSP